MNFEVTRVAAVLLPLCCLFKAVHSNLRLRTYKMGGGCFD